MTEDSNISEAIDSIILSDQDPSFLFQRYVNQFITNRDLFLKELLIRLSKNKLEKFCDSIVWREPSAPRYIYEEAHLRLAEQKIRPTDSTDLLVVFRQREMAYEIWKKNRFFELQLLLPSIQKEIGDGSKSSTPINKVVKKVGLKIISTVDPTVIYKQLVKNDLIEENSSEENFCKTFTQNRDFCDPPIIWKSTLATLAYFIRLLISKDIITKPRGFYKDFETNKYFLPEGKDQIGNFKDAFSKATRIPEKSPEVEVYHTIDEVIKKVQLS